MLNDCRDEAKAFLQLIGSSEQGAQIAGMFQEEIEVLKRALATGDESSTKHEIYDLLFLLMEMAVVLNVDLDEEWERGRERKNVKYVADDHTKRRARAVFGAFRDIRADVSENHDRYLGGRHRA